MSLDGLKINFVEFYNNIGIKECHWNTESSECGVIFYPNIVYIQKLNSKKRKHGKLLLEYVLNYLVDNKEIIKLNYPNDTGFYVHLDDCSKLEFGDYHLPLYFVMFLKYGEISWYAQFGFTFRLSKDKCENYYREYYRNQKNKILKITCAEAVSLMSKYVEKYPMLTSIIDHLFSSKELMTDSMQNFNFENLKKYPKPNFGTLLQDVFDLEIFDISWVRKIE